LKGETGAPISKSAFTVQSQFKPIKNRRSVSVPIPASAVF
jgi:hypothetical protein